MVESIKIIIKFFNSIFHENNNADRSQSNRDEEEAQALLKYFHADNPGCRRAIWSILTLHVMDELAKPLFRQEHDVMLIIKIELF